MSSLALPLIDPSRPTINGSVIVSPTRALTTLVWMPDRPGRRPLIVFAHGFQVGPDPYIPLCKAWAADGYVVATPEFPLIDAAVAGANLNENDIVNQPADVRLVLDSLVAATSPVASHIDSSRVALVGHSDGAQTVLAAGISPPPPGEPAVRAVIAMSVSPLPGVTSTANPPILVTQGDADTIDSPAEGYATYDMAAGPKYLRILHGAGHLPPLEPGSVWLPVIERVTGDFLAAYDGGGGKASAIVADANSSPLVSLRQG